MGWKKKKIVRVKLNQNSLTLEISPGEYRNQPEYTGKGPDYTSGGGEFIFTSGGRDYEDQTWCASSTPIPYPMLQIPSFFHIKNTPCMIFVLDQGGQHQYGYCRINSFCVILYLTTVISTVRIAE